MDNEKVLIPDYSPTPIDELVPRVQHLRTHFHLLQGSPLHVRKSQLRQLNNLLVDHTQAFQKALFKDFRKSDMIVHLTEIGPIINEIHDALNSLDQWTRPKATKKGWLQLLDTVYVQSEPLGTVLIIAPWNYPLYLSLLPLVSAIASGNSAVIKPSELVPHFSATLAQLFPKYMDPNLYTVILGGVPETTKLLTCKFEHIFYTGNSNVARIIMAAAAKHLTPVTLELGGKCPVILHESANLQLAAKRIVFGKFLNCGQTCVAPDYILCPRSKRDELLKELIHCIQSFYGPNPQQSKDYNRIVNKHHFQRLQSLLPTKDTKDPCTIAYGGILDMSDLYFSPTLLNDVEWTSPCMQQEIFGPILPILVYSTFSEALQKIRDQANPLAIYLFANSISVAHQVGPATQSGALVLNDTIMQLATEGLPFGGVGESGFGNYHGKFGFDTFSYQRSYLLKPFWLEYLNSLRYPPLTEKGFTFINWLLFKKVK
ncbi:Aldehyde dehydrogenase [Coelomomyces lativittatus]|nr:Aldehyde dehydrogenase [Coelomomyces lativittatus]